MTHGKMFLVLSLSAVCLAGCGGSARSSVSAPAALTAPDAGVMLAAAQEALGRMHFVMDKYDVEAGYLRTRPQRAGQFFEPWRRDNASAAAFGQANLNSLRRTVEVYVEPQDWTSQLRCVVTVEKLSIPPRPMRGMSWMAGMYTESDRRLQTLMLDATETERVEWIDLGPDHALEQRIVTEIQRQLRKG
jgi:hypothetical protein